MTDAVEIPVPDNEDQRLRFLDGLNLLGSSPDPEFDRLTTLGARLLDVPVAQVSIVERDREWYKSCHGLEHDQSPREQSICSHAILNPEEPTVIENLEEDDQIDVATSSSGEFQPKSYAGISIVIDGHPIGTFCVRDDQPREFSDRDLENLRILAEQTEDLIEGRRIEEELSLKNRALDHLQQGLIITDPRQDDNPIVYANKGFEKLTGYDHSEVIGRNCRFLQGDDTEEETVDEIRRAINAGESTRVTLRNYRKDGTLFWNHLSITPVRNNSGTITHFVGIQKDVSQRKQAQHELREERNRLKRIFDTSITAFTIVDDEGNITFANPRAEEIFGLELSQVEGMAYNDPDFTITDVDGNELPDDQLPFNQIMRTGEPVENVQHAIEHPDGERRILSINGAPLTTEDGDISEIVFSIDDITEQTARQQELKRVQERFSVAEQAANAGVWEWNIESDEVIWDDSMEQLLGMEPGSFAETFEAFVQHVHPEDRDRVKNTVRNALDKNEDLKMELRMRHEKGEDIWCESRARLLSSEDGTPERMVGATINITDRKQLEDQLRRSQEFLRRLNDISADTERSLDEKIMAVLELGRDQFDCSYGFVTRINDDSQKISHAVGDHELIQPGNTGSLEDAYCRETIDRDEPLVLHSKREVLESVGEESYERYGLGCYLGGKLVLNGVLEGTVCFADSCPEQCFSEQEKEQLEYIVQWIRAELERNRAQQERDRLINIIEASPDFVSTANPEGELNYANPSLKEEYDLGQDLSEHQISDFHPEEVVEFIKNEAMPSAVEEGTWQGETRMVDSEGEEFPVSQVITAHRDKDGQIKQFSTIIRDISTLVETTVSRNYLENVLSTLPGALVITDPAGTIQRVNPALENLLHYSEEQLRGQDLDTIIGGKANIDSLIERIEDGPLNGEEINFVTSEGERIPVLFFGNVLRDDDGSHRGYVCVGSDLRDLKEATHQLELFREIMEEGPSGLHVIHPESAEIIDVNRTFVEQLGYDDRDEVLGKTIHDIDPELGDTMTWEGLMDNVESRGTIVLETTHRRKDGTTFPVEIRGNYQHIGGEEYLAAHALDITERKQRERALRESEQRFRNLAESLNQVFWITDPEFDQFEYVSPRYEDWWDQPVDRIYEDKFAWTERVHSDDVEDLNQAMKEHVVEAQDPGDYEGLGLEFRLENPDGSDRWCWLDGTPITDEAGNVVRVMGFINDITEQKQSQRRIRTFFESPMAFRAVLDPDGTILEINQPAAEAMNATKEDYIGETFWETPIWSPDPDLKNDIQQKVSRARGGEIIRDEGPFFVGDEQRRYGEHLFNPATDEAGNVQFIFAEGRDITERRETREQLEESQERFEQLANSIDEIFWVVEPDWSNVEYINPAYEEIVGRDREVLLNEDPTDFLEGFHPEDRDRSREMMEQLSRGENVDWEARVNPGEDYNRWLSIHGRARINEDGEVTRILGTAQDITEQKNAQQNLAESERRFREMAENIDEIIYMFTGDWSEMLYVNPRYEEIWGRPREKIQEDPRDFLNGIHPDDRDRVRDAMNRMSNGEELSLEYRVNPREDYRRWVAADGLPVEQNGEITRIVGTVRDITERKQAQEELKQALSEKDTLLKEVHHRVKNNLQVISAMLRLQEDQIDVPAVNEQLELTLNRIQSMAMTHEMLYQSEDLDAIDFPDYVEQLLDHLYQSYRTEARQVDYDADVDDVEVDLDTAIPCGLIITELFTNSLQHGFEPTEEGTVDVCFQKVGNEYELSVSDTGKGFPEDFDPDKTDSLGFQLIDALVSGNLRGALEIDASGQGARVTVRFSHE